MKTKPHSFFVIEINDSIPKIKNKIKKNKAILSSMMIISHYDTIVRTQIIRELKNVKDFQDESVAERAIAPTHHKLP